MNGTIAAVVVTYNRKSLLTECLDALLGQTRSLDMIILVDNASTDGTPELLDELGYLDNALIDYVRLPQNLGGAGGFYTGIKRGYQAGYHWLWVMDDDAEPEPSALECLCRSEVTNSPETVAVACKKIGKDARIQAHHRAWFSERRGLVPVPAHEYAEEQVRIDHSSFVGLAIRSSVITSAGLPRQDFYIWCDDLEYCLRMGQHGEIWLINSSIIKHKDDPVPSNRYRWLLWTPEKLLPVEVFWKQLCGWRNMEYIRRTYGAGSVPRSLWRLLKRVGKIVVLEDHKLFRLGWTLVFYIDSFQPRFRARPPMPRTITTMEERRGVAKR